MGAYLSFMFRENPPGPSSLPFSALPPADNGSTAPAPALSSAIAPPPVPFTPNATPFFAKHGITHNGRPFPSPDLPGSTPVVSETRLRELQTEAGTGVTGFFRSILSHFPPKFLRDACISASGFLILNTLLPSILPKVMPKFNELSIDTRSKFVFYISATLHHLVVAPWASGLVLRWFQESQMQGPDHHIDYTNAMPLASFTSGYFIADFLGTLKHAFTNPDFFLHHVAALLIIWRGVDNRLMRFFPHFLVCEWSTILLNALWMLRTYKMTDSSLYKLTGVLFVLTFTLTRIVNLPIMVTTAFTKFRPLVNEVLGAFQWAVPAVTLLQVYWWIKILQRFAPMVRGMLGGTSS